MCIALTHFLWMHLPWSLYQWQLYPQLPDRINYSPRLFAYYIHSWMSLLCKILFYQNYPMCSSDNRRFYHLLWSSYLWSSDSHSSYCWLLSKLADKKIHKQIQGFVFSLKTILKIQSLHIRVYHLISSLPFQHPAALYNFFHLSWSVLLILYNQSYENPYLLLPYPGNKMQKT